MDPNEILEYFPKTDFRKSKEVHSILLNKY